MLSRIPFFFVILVLLCVPMASHATEGSTVVTVDIKKILKEAKVTKHVNEQITSKREVLQKKVSKQEEALRKEDKELAKERSVLAKDVFEKKVKEFREKVAKAQRDIQQENDKMQKAYNKAMAKVQETVVGVISELSEKNGFIVAIPKRQVLFIKKSQDITGDVLSLLDNRLPKLEVKVEG